VLHDTVHEETVMKQVRVGLSLVSLVEIQFLQTKH
jgi:hypothetical protein